MDDIFNVCPGTKVNPSSWWPQRDYVSLRIPMNNWWTSEKKTGILYLMWKNSKFFPVAIKHIDDDITRTDLSGQSRDSAILTDVLGKQTVDKQRQLHYPVSTFHQDGCCQRVASSTLWFADELLFNMLPTLLNDKHMSIIFPCCGAIFNFQFSWTN